MELKLDRRNLFLLTTAHAFNDMNQGAIPALIPFIVSSQGLNYIGAAGITVASTLISSLLQPLLGLTSDRKPIPWLIPLGILIGGAGVALSGFMNAYKLILAVLLLSGIGTAAFHPEAYRFANYFSRRQTATGMSIFSVGGNLGFAIGPLVLTFSVLHWGLSGTLILIIPALIMSLIYVIDLPHLHHLRNHTETNQMATQKSDWKAFSLLLTIIVVRSMAYYSLSSFVPLFLINYRHFPTAVANSALTIMSVASVLGALVGGALADHWGHKRVLFLLAITISLMIFLFVFSSSWWLFVFIAIASGGLAASFTISMVMGQYYGRANIGLSSGLTTGLAIGLGGISAPLFGLFADSLGLAATLNLTGVLPLIAALIVLRLPNQFSPEEIA
ncbi:MAG: MFS transporter [Anaerolineales bacterium]